MFQSGGNVDIGGGYAFIVAAGGICETSVHCPYFCCETKTDVKKKKVLI